MYDVMRMCALFRKQLNFPTKHPWASYKHVHVYRARACTIIGASLSEPLLDELAGAMFWYIYIYIYIFVSMGSPFGPAYIGPPVNAQRANVRPAE